MCSINCLSACLSGINSYLFSGEAEHACFPAAVPLWYILLLHQAEGAGGSQHHLDRRVCHTETEVQDTQLHTHLPGNKVIKQEPLEHVLHLTYNSTM